MSFFKSLFGKTNNENHSVTLPTGIQPNDDMVTISFSTSQSNESFNSFDSLAKTNLETALQQCKMLKSDLVVFNDFADGCCAECKKLKGRVYSISGKNRKFPPLPEYAKKHGNFHAGCRCFMSAYFEGQGDIFYNGKQVNPIKASKRPFIDDRSETEKQAYQRYLDSRKEEQNKERDRLEYEKLLKKLPEYAPKTFASYRRMKKAKSQNFMKILEKATSFGVEIELDS